MAHALINLSDEHLQLCTIAGVFGLYSHKSYNHPLFSLPCITFTHSDSGLMTPSGVVLILCCKAERVTGPKFPSALIFNSDWSIRTTIPKLNRRDELIRPISNLSTDDPVFDSTIQDFLQSPCGGRSPRTVDC